MYFRGRGVAQDDRQAVLWWQKAADRSRAEAQFSLGIMYLEGRGVTQDYVEGYAWFILAAANGAEFKSRDDLRQMMTQEQIAAGEQRAKALQARIERK